MGDGCGEGDGSGNRWGPYRHPSFNDHPLYGYGGNSSYGVPLETPTVAFDQIATLKSREYDVFINRWGLDLTRFEYELYIVLNIHGFRPFLNTVNIMDTFPISERIDKALKGAFVHVAIFSKGYAESDDCLDELCEILKSERRIIPIFYDVKSIDLQRIEDGLYREAFINHQKSGRTEKIPIWKEALRKVIDYKGFGMDEVNG